MLSGDCLELSGAAWEPSGLSEAVLGAVCELSGIVIWGCLGLSGAVWGCLDLPGGCLWAAWGCQGLSGIV